MLEATTLHIDIARNWKTVYDAIWRPDFFPRWASGLSRSTLERDGDAWTATGPAGPVRIRFTEHNAFGVMDHHVEIGDGTVVDVPMRVISNGDGATVVLVLFRQPGMSDDTLRDDIATVERDLATLKAIVEA